MLLMATGNGYKMLLPSEAVKKILARMLSGKMLQNPTQNFRPVHMA